METSDTKAVDEAPVEDLDMPEEQAESVKGGLKAGASEVLMETVTVHGRPRAPGGVEQQHNETLVVLR
jgi:hypothetical protein